MRLFIAIFALSLPFSVNAFAAKFECKDVKGNLVEMTYETHFMSHPTVRLGEGLQIPVTPLPKVKTGYDLQSEWVSCSFKGQPNCLLDLYSTFKFPLNRAYYRVTGDGYWSSSSVGYPEGYSENLYIDSELIGDGRSSREGKGLVFRQISSSRFIDNPDIYVCSRTDY